MDFCFCKRALAFLVSSWTLFIVASSVEGLNGDSRVRGVNLGGWLVIEGWIKPSLFDEIPNRDMLDGTQVQFKSVVLQKYISAQNGGGTNLTVDKDVPFSWETFKLWRISESIFQVRTFQGQFLTCNGDGSPVTAMANSTGDTETFHIERNSANRVHIKQKNGAYIQASINNDLTANYPGVPGWDDNRATFEMFVVANDLHGDYQLANGYGYIKAQEVLNNHRSTFITINDFNFLYKQGINTVRIPIGWWIVFDPNPPLPFIGGSLEALDNAFLWARVYNIKCIIDLHAAPGSQNGQEHSASRDGTTNWANSPETFMQTLNVIDFLASRYANHPSLLGFELLNEPSAATVPLDVLVSYYKQGYQIVRKYSSTAYVIFCQRIGNADPFELYRANLGSINTVVDLHYYNLFSSLFVNMSSLDNIQYIYKIRESQLQSLNNANGPLVFIGEWVNEWDVTNASQTDYQEFGNAQLELYNSASFGWTYWTLKNDQKHWDFKWNIKNNYLLLQLGFASCKRVPDILSILGFICCFLFQHK